MTNVEIIHCTAATELYRHYDGQTNAQDAYIELDLRDASLLADWDAEIGGAVPFSVYHGFERRYSIPVLTSKAANRVMAEISPLANRILADWSEEWDGNNMVARLGEDAHAAEEEIVEHLGRYLDDQSQGFEDADLVAEWDLEGAVNGSEAEDYNITAETTDERLEEIEKEILGDLAGCGDSEVTVCPELTGHLRGLRDEAIQEDQRDVWAIVAETGDRVDGVELAEVDREAVDHLWTLTEFTELARQSGYGLEHPEVLIYLQSGSDQLALPDGLGSLRLEVPSRVEAAVVAVERPAS